MAAARSVVGRDEELAEVDRFLASAAEGPAALVLSGEPGIGKTILWEAAVEDAVTRGYHVLAHRSVETEAGLAFAGLSDLVAPAFDEVVDALPPVRRTALEVALLLREPGEAPPDPRAIGLGLLGVLQTLARERPVLVALDDMQWLDRSSAMVIPVALRRVRDERIGLLAAVRDAPAVRPAFAPDAAMPDVPVRHVRMGRLDMSALHRLLRDSLGLELSRPRLARIERTSGGNPFFALELARALAAGGAAAEDAPVPQTLQELLGDRLSGLPAECADVLLTAAASPRPTVELLAAADGDEARVQRALEAAAGDRVIGFDGRLVRFAHPLLASLCYQQAPPWKRDAAHARLAEVVRDIEERARHLALARHGEEATLAAELEAAAAHAAARGATAAAAELAELAALRTPAERADERRRRRFEAAGNHHLAGDFERATVMYRSLLAEVPAGVERADILYALATTGTVDLPTRTRWCEEALNEAADDDGRSAQILGYLSITHWLGGDVRAALADARDGLVRAQRAGNPALLAGALGRVGLMEMWSLEDSGALERGVTIEQTLPQPLIFHESPTFILAVRLYDRDELDRARAMLEAIEAAALERGDEHTRAWVTMTLPRLEWLSGRWSVALERNAVAQQLAEQVQEPQLLAEVYGNYARLQCELGLVDEARNSARKALDITRTISDEPITIQTLTALGRVELSLGNLEEAIRHLDGLPDRLLRTGQLSPGAGPWADTIEALVAGGELERARAYLEQFEGIAARSTRWARLGAARCAGLLAATEGEHDRALLALQRSLDEDEPPTYPFERARTLLAMGVVRRKALQRRAAREALEESLAVFEHLGARVWGDRARDELARISGRRSSADELTEAEHRVAGLAAEGRSNKEIAAELFIGVGTVEAHLHRVFRKLGVRSRTELARRLPTPVDE